MKWFITTCFVLTIYLCGRKDFRCRHDKRPPSVAQASDRLILGCPHLSEPLILRINPIIKYANETYLATCDQFGPAW